MTAAHAPDGSPVAFFARLPAEPAAGHVRAALAPGATVLELGCGAGRLSRALAAAGHHVTAVDQSAEMLAHAAGYERVEPVLADIERLRLGRMFDAVILPSYLINTTDGRQRAALLATCRRHVAPTGRVIIQRYQPEWAATAVDEASDEDGFGFRFRVLERQGDRFRAEMTYSHGGERWRQQVSGEVIDDEAFAEAVGEAGLMVKRWIDVWRTWAEVTPA